MELAPAAAAHHRLTPVAVAAAVVIAIGGSSVGTAFDHADAAALANAVAIAFGLGTVAIVGAVVCLTVPTNPVGWLPTAGLGATAPNTTPVATAATAMTKGSPAFDRAGQRGPPYTP